MWSCVRGVTGIGAIARGDAVLLPGIGKMERGRDDGRSCCGDWGSGTLRGEPLSTEALRFITNRHGGYKVKARKHIGCTMTHLQRLSFSHKSVIPDFNLRICCISGGYELFRATYIPPRCDLHWRNVLLFARVSDGEADVNSAVLTSWSFLLTLPFTNLCNGFRRLRPAICGTSSSLWLSREGMRPSPSISAFAGGALGFADPAAAEWSMGWEE